MSTFDHDSIVDLQKITYSNYVKRLLSDNGSFLFKLWSGDLVETLKLELEKNFKKVKIIKPKASRNDSAEIFVLCLKYKKE
jgi:23S rRNA (uridine2552-2'-O)-methyltransferase